MSRWPLWLSLLALVSRLFHLGHDLFWYDETFTALISRLSFPDMLQAVRGDVHPPLWYAITWTLSHIAPQSETLLRLPSAIAGALTVWQLYKLVDRTAGNKPAIIAAGLLAILPGQLYYAQEARMYALLSLFVIVGANAALERNWLRLSLCCTLIMFTQNLGVFYAAILGAWGLWQGRMAFIRKLWPAAGYLPWAPVAIEQTTRLAGGFWLPPPANIGLAFYPLFFTTLGPNYPQGLFIHAISIPMILTGVALWHMRTQFKQALPLLALAFLPVGGMYAVSQLWRPVLLDRALLPSGAALVGIWAHGFTLAPTWVKRLTAGIALPLIVAGAAFYYFDPVGRRPSDEAAFHIVGDNWQAGDAVYHISISSEISYSYYLGQYPSYVLPEAGDLAQSLTDRTKFAMGIKQKERSPAQLKADGYKRLWLMVFDTPATSAFELQTVRDYISQYRVIQTWQVKNVKLEKFEIVLIEL